jgi:YesN/AraC family two-component response regulator
MQYINIVRISHAKDMLENTNHHIDYISSAVGYGNISRFIRNFKKDSGITPHHYRVISNKEKLS